MAYEVIIAIIVLLEVLTIGSGIIVFYFMRRYLRKKLQRKNLGFKFDLILTAISFLAIVVVNALLLIFNTSIFLMTK